MKYMKVYINTLLYLFICHHLTAQINTKESELNRYILKIEKVITPGLKDFINGHNINGKVDIKIYPYCYIQDFCDISGKSYLSRLIIDTTIVYVLIGREGKYIGITGEPNKITEKYYMYNRENDSQLVEQLQLIEYAERISTNIFFFYFIKEEKYSNRFLGIIKNGQIQLINDKLIKLDELNSATINQYGSLDKLCELKKLEAYKDSISNMSADNAKQILKTSYTEWLKYYPTDTLSALRVFLEELETLVEITPEQSVLLKKIIISRLRKWDLNNFSGAGIPFLSEDISYEVQSVLTIKQYCVYARKRTYRNLERSIAGNILYFYYSKDKKTSDEQIDKIIKKEVFKY